MEKNVIESCIFNGLTFVKCNFFCVCENKSGTFQSQCSNASFLLFFMVTHKEGNIRSIKKCERGIITISPTPQDNIVHISYMPHIRLVYATNTKRICGIYQMPMGCLFRYERKSKMKIEDGLVNN